MESPSSALTYGEYLTQLGSYIYDNKPILPEALFIGGGFTEFVLEKVPRPFVEGPITSDQAERIGKLLAFSSQIQKATPKINSEVFDIWAEETKRVLPSKNRMGQGIIHDNFNGSLGGGSPQNALRIGKKS